MLLALSLALGCGASSRGSGAPAPSDGGSAGSDAGTGGEASAAAGAAGTSSLGCAGFGTSLGCIDSCSTKTPTAVAAACADGSWECPAQSTSFRDCPPESCYGRLDSCCDFSVGAEATRECGSDGMLLGCPTEFDVTERGAFCAPEVVEATSCDALNGTACSEAAFRCSQGSGCGKVTCACEAGLDGALLWKCVSRLC